jgi:HSP20 family protein
MSQLLRRSLFVQDPSLLSQGVLGWDPFARAARPAAWSPAFEVKETKDAFVVKADVPGITEENLDISVQNNILMISSQRNQDPLAEGEAFSVEERRFGAFVRRFSLPQTADGEHIDARLAQGVLTVTIRKKSSAGPRKIAVGK